MKKKKTNWKTTDNRFVAFLDLLGFKDKVMRNSHDDIYSELNKISSLKKSIESSVTKDIITKNFEDVDIYIVSFSDSIVLFSKNDSIDNFKFFTFALRSIFASTIRNKIALKGGISHGTISLNKSEQIYFGQPIIDAYLIEEDVNYFGVVCHNSIDKYLKENENLDVEILSNGYKFVNTPLKCGTINHYNLDWYYTALLENERDLKDDEKVNVIINILKSFYVTVSGSPRRYVENSISIVEKMYSNNQITLSPTKLI
jgi:hypothetical protein